MIMINKKEATKPKRLSDKEMRELLKRAKDKADQMPEEEGSCSVEVFCSGKDIAKSNGTLKSKK
jgi:hypothetical protein